MKLVEERVYQLLVNDAELNQLMDRIRGGVFDPRKVFKQGIFTYEIPDIFRKGELAPFIRINPIDENPAFFMDDDNAAEEQTVQVDFWCKNATATGEMKRLIDNILKRNGHIQYDSVRYKDPDINLIMNVRKYRVFDFE